MNRHSPQSTNRHSPQRSTRTSLVLSGNVRQKTRSFWLLALISIRHSCVASGSADPDHVQAPNCTQLVLLGAHLSLQPKMHRGARVALSAGTQLMSDSEGHHVVVLGVTTGCGHTALNKGVPEVTLFPLRVRAELQVHLRPALLSLHSFWCTCLPPCCCFCICIVSSS